MHQQYFGAPGCSNRFSKRPRVSRVTSVKRMPLRSGFSGSEPFERLGVGELLHRVLANPARHLVGRCRELPGRGPQGSSRMNLARFAQGVNDAAGADRVSVVTGFFRFDPSVAVHERDHFDGS
jgi:hypothetical protein